MTPFDMTRFLSPSFIPGRFTKLCLRFLSRHALLLLLLSAVSPVAKAMTIETIEIRGNRITKPFVILAEMEHQPGSMVTEESLDRDRARLESIGLFTRAQLTLDTLTAETAVLIVEVTELWYIWPSLFLAFDDDNPSRSGFGALVSHDNFRGRRETLAISARIGFIEGEQFTWDIPYLTSRNLNWSMAVKAKSIRESEPRSLVDWDGIHLLERSLQGSVGYRFNLENSLSSDASFTQIRFDSEDGQPLALTSSSSSQGDLYATLGIGFQRDTRHYKPWPNQGYLFGFRLSGGMVTNQQEVAMLQPELQFVRYQRLAPGTFLAGRIDTRWMIGNTPPYRRLLMNRDNGIRTAMSGSFSGRWRHIASLELRNDLIPIQYVTLRTFSFFQHYARNLKFGLSSALFVDAGMTGGILSNDRGYSDSSAGSGEEVAYGAGLVIHVPYRDIVRLELSRSAFHPGDGLLLRVRIGASF